MSTDARVAVVTGAARGIGRAIAGRLAADGLSVALWDLNGRGVRSAAVELRAAGFDAEAWTVDVSKSRQVQRAAEAVIARWGHVDVLVNNAGWDRLGFFLESREDVWDRVIGVNYRGVLNTCRYIGPSITMSASAGRIIQVASDTAKLGGPLESVYSGAKGAVVSFSRALARELAPSGVTVNVVCPGSTDTPLFHEGARLIEADPRFKRFFPADLVDAQLSRIPMGRLGLPSDIANAVSFFADARAEHITGQVLSVDGGETMY